MIERIAPQFFSANMPGTLLLCGQARVRVRGVYEECRQKGVEFIREHGDKPWNAMEFFVKDCDGRLLYFGAPVQD